MSEKKATAIYAAIHEEIIQLRISLARSPQTGDKLDAMIAHAGDRAGAKAVEAYKKPLRPPSGGHRDA